MQTQSTVSDDAPSDLTAPQRKAALVVFAVVLVVLVGLGIVLDRVTTQSTPSVFGPPPAVPFPRTVTDDFGTRPGPGLGRAQTGQRWAVPEGVWSVSGDTAGLVTPAKVGSSLALINVGRGAGNISVTAQTVAKGVGLAFRCQSPLSCWTLTAVPEFGTWKLTKITAAIPSDQDDIGTTPVAPGTRLRVANGPDGFDIFVNDVLARHVDDRELNDASLAGLIANAEVGATAGRFADFAAEQTNIVGSDAPVRDAFDRQNANSLRSTPTGQRWSTAGGTWGIKGREAVLQSQPSLRPSIATVDIGRAEGWIQVTASTMPEGAGVVFRYADERNYWRVVAVPGYATFNVFKVLNGIETRVGSTDLTSYGNTTTVGIRLRDDEITFFVDGFETVTMRSDELIDAHRAGMVVASPKGLGARFAGFAAGPLELAGVQP